MAFGTLPDEDISRAKTLLSKYPLASVKEIAAVMGVDYPSLLQQLGGQEFAIIAPPFNEKYVEHMKRCESE